MTSRNREGWHSTFQVDEQFDRTLTSLMIHYELPSQADVLRKAVALLRLAQQNEQADGSVVIRDARGADVRVKVR